MAFDGHSRYKLNRPPTDRESSARLHVDKPCADVAKSVGTVFKATNTYLEVCDGLHREKGWGLLTFLTAGIAFLGLIAMFLWLATHMPMAVRAKGEEGIVYLLLVLFTLAGIGALAITVRALLVDCFGYIRKPIRFNRADRTIYAFRHNGPGGVISVPWDSAFLYVERKPKAGLGGTAPRVVRCLVLNDKGLVVGTFSIGKRVVLAFDENSPAGQQVMEQLYQDFEYIRRFMGEGPSSVPPVAELLSTEVSFRNSLRMQFEDVPDIVNSGHPLLWLLLAVTALPSLIQATVYYVAQLTCREPVWPEAVERACMATTTRTEGVAS
jgi:succinate dehydrogenase/fumarate reductase cytochrome b subunit